MGLIVINDPEIDVPAIMNRIKAKASIRRVRLDANLRASATTLHLQAKSQLTSIRQLLSDFGDIGVPARGLKSKLGWWVKRIVRKLISRHLYRQQQINERMANNLEIHARLMLDLSSAVARSFEVLSLSSHATSTAIPAIPVSHPEQVLRYVPHLEKSMPVVHLGSGLGEYVEVLLREGYQIFGCEAAKQKVDECLASDLPVQHIDAETFLVTTADSSLGGIVLSLRLDQTTPVVATRVLNLCMRKLKDRCSLVLECVDVSLVKKWLDTLEVKATVQLDGSGISAIVVKK